jgi:hypothetical protein
MGQHDLVAEQGCGVVAFVPAVLVEVDDLADVDAGGVAPVADLVQGVQ